MVEIIVFVISTQWSEFSNFNTLFLDISAGITDSFEGRVAYFIGGFTVFGAFRVLSFELKDGKRYTWSQFQAPNKAFLESDQARGLREQDGANFISASLANKTGVAASASPLL